MTSRDQQKEQAKQLNSALEARARAQLKVYEHQDKVRQSRQQHEATRAQGNSASDPAQRKRLDTESTHRQRKLDRAEARHAKLRGTYRECNDQVQRHVDAIGNDRERRVAELTAGREHAATRLYRLKHGTTAHRRAEARFNSINREIHQAQSKKGTYVKQRDCRHETKEVENVQSRRLSDGSTRIHDLYERPIRNDALNWRRTAVGRVQDRRARSKARGEFGPSQKKADAGHPLSIEGGGDPGKSNYLFPQDRYQNRSGTWRVSERAARRIASDNPNQQFHESVKKSYHPEKYGSTPTHTRHRVVEVHGKSRQTVREVVHGNFGPARNARKRPPPSAFGAKRTAVRQPTNLQRRTQMTNHNPRPRPAKPAQATPRRTQQRPAPRTEWAKKSIESSRHRQAARITQQKQQMRMARVHPQRLQPPTMKKR